MNSFVGTMECYAHIDNGDDKMIRIPFSYSHCGSNHCFLTLRERGNTVELLDSKGCRIMIVPDGASLANVLSNLNKGEYDKHE